MGAVSTARLCHCAHTAHVALVLSLVLTVAAVAAGFAQVALAVPGASPVHKATIVPRGHALGMVTQVGVSANTEIGVLYVCAILL
jgi:ATP-dependent Zn protease